jgi:LmbE family N-acetylglucosaminyl deacetylase
MTRTLAAVAVILGAALVWMPAEAQSPALPVPSALEPASAGGIAVVDRALAKLSTHRRLLMIGAHPDDEDTSILALVSRGLGGEAAYLALSRGDGGQNLIGPELGVGLGVIRTQELVSARRVDGAHQFFTRAFDFGYIRSLEETLERWPREVLLEDAARVVWRFRPQVIVAVFTSEGGGGHGQHKAAGWTAEQIVPVAGDAGRFPSLVEEGWLPWQPEAFFRRVFFDPERASMRFSLGDIEGLTGRSMLQIAMQSRSQHRSQDMGMLQPLGTRRGGVEWVAGPGGPETDNLFAGIDTRLAAIAEPIANVETRAAVARELEAAEAAARATRAVLTPGDLSASVEGLIRTLGALARARSAARAADDPARRIVGELIDEKIAIAEVGLAAAAGIGLEATYDRETVAPGQVAGVTVQVWNAGSEVVQIDSIAMRPAAGWSVSPKDGVAGPVGSGELTEWVFEAGAARNAQPSMPYYLVRARRGDLYDWSAADPESRGLPHQAPELSAEVDLIVAGQRITLDREVVHRTRDQALGEVRRPVRIVPAIEVSIDPALALWTTRTTGEHEVRVSLRSHLETSVRGRLVVDAPAGWEVGEPAFELREPGGQDTITLRIARPNGIEPGLHDVRFEARSEDGTESHLALPLMEYEHIRPTPLPIPAEMRVSAFDLALPDVGTVGYVRGASDRVPEFLRQVGLEIELLDAEALEDGDLSRFRVIVVGSRAYEIDPALVSANARLIEFARSGGLLVVQYQQYQFVRGGYAPYRLEITRPHDRITDETAPVRILAPEHPVFSTPNRLGESDWEGWVQERGLYLANSWDEAFTPLLAMRDPGMEEQSGGLLVAPVGDGLYVYTGLAFFRQLPAGVAGGYRLFANILALSE